MQFKILVFQDKLGITPGYKSSWEEMLLSAGLLDSSHRFFFERSYAHFKLDDLLQIKGNRKSPGFVEDPTCQIKLLKWVWEKIKFHGATHIVMMDPALFFIVNQHWEQATHDLLRGGVYHIRARPEETQTLPVLIMCPIHSINRGMKPKDIAALNNGFDSRDEWDDMYKGAKLRIAPSEELESESNGSEEEQEAEDQTHWWYAPVVIPFGKFCFQRDLNKLGRILRSQNQ